MDYRAKPGVSLKKLPLKAASVADRGAAQQTQIPGRLEFLTLADLQGRVNQAGGFRWLVDGLVPAVGLSLVHGLPHALKSTFVASMAATVTRGGLFAGRPVERGAAILALLEHSDASVAGLLTAATCGSEFDALILRRFRLQEDDDVEALVAKADQIGCKIIAIDSLRAVCEIDENDSGEVAQIGHALKKLTAEKRSVVVIAHDNKSGTLRGSTALAALMDSTLHLHAAGDRVTVDAKHHDAPQERFVLRVTRGDGQLEFTLIDSPDADASDEEIKKAVVETLRERPRLKATELRDAVRRRVRCRNDRITKIVKMLEDEGVIENVSGSKRNQEWVLREAGPPGRVEGTAFGGARPSTNEAKHHEDVHGRGPARPPGPPKGGAGAGQRAPKPRPVPGRDRAGDQYQ